MTMGDKGGELPGHPYGGGEVKCNLDCWVTKEGLWEIYGFQFLVIIRR
jgi:hypothetical protein